MINYPLLSIGREHFIAFWVALLHLQSTSQIRLKIAFGFFSTVALILLFLSGSRGGWVAGLVGIIIFLYKIFDG